MTKGILPPATKPSPPETNTLDVVSLPDTLRKYIGPLDRFIKNKTIPMFCLVSY